MFVHSEKVPRLYKSAAKILKDYKENSGNIKDLLYQRKHPRVKSLYALVCTTLEHYTNIENLIKKSELLVNEPRFDPWIARILLTELFFGKRKLEGSSKPVETILKYKDTIEGFISDKEYENNSVIKVYRPRFVRINTLKVTLEEALNCFRDEGWQFLPFNNNNYEEFLNQCNALEEGQFMIDMHIKELLIFSPKTEFYNHQAYKWGSIILQDKASCLAVELLNPSVGSKILDMCAAPGMKTTHLAAKINDDGIIYAIERDERRFEVLNKMVESSGATCVKTMNKDVLKVTAEDCPEVEYILVDPSCSGSGIAQRITIDGKNEKPDPERLRKLSSLQVVILKHALLHFPQAKRVVYSTCSIYPEENEQVVEEVLNHKINFKLVSARNLLTSPWKSILNENSISDYCISTKPDEDLTNGFFIAVFERIETDQVQSESKDEKKTNQKTKRRTVENAIICEEDSINSKNNIAETAMGNKKHKKRKHKENDCIPNSTALESTEESSAKIQDEAEGILNVKKNKKKLKKSDRADDNFEINKVPSENDFTEDTLEVRKSKKNYKKGAISEQTLLHHEVKHKKSKKDKLSTEDLNKISTNEDEQDKVKNESVSKKKRKRDKFKHSDDLENNEKAELLTEYTEDHSHSSSKKSKKLSKHSNNISLQKANENHVLQLNLDEADVDKPKKKKKKTYENKQLRGE